MKLTRQEMFDRAYRGLASQGWRRAYEVNSCEYVTDDGRRCAWGWVDPSLTDEDSGDVQGLFDKERGVAAYLSLDDLRFAMALQDAHDSSTDDTLERDLRAFAGRQGLAIPVLP